MNFSLTTTIKRESRVHVWNSYFIWLKIGSFHPKFDKIYSFYQYSQPIYDVMQKNWWYRVCSTCKLWVYRFHKRHRYKVLVIIWPVMCGDLHLESLCWYWYCFDIVDWELFTVKHNLFIQRKLGKMLCSRSRTLFSPNLPVMWCKSLRLVRIWDSDQS